MGQSLKNKEFSQNPFFDKLFQTLIKSSMTGIQETSSSQDGLETGRTSASVWSSACMADDIRKSPVRVYPNSTARNIYSWKL